MHKRISSAIMLALMPACCLVLPAAQSNDSGTAESKRNAHLSKADSIQRQALSEAAILTNKAKRLNLLLESEDAVKMCDRAIQKDSSYAPAYLARSEANCALGNTEESLKDLTIAAKQEKYRNDAMRERARIYYALRRYKQSLADLNSIMIGRSTDGAYLQRARTYLALNKPALAALDFTSALDQKPHNYQLLCERSNCYLEAGQWSNALADYNEAIALDEKNNEGMSNAQLYEGRAQAYEKLGKTVLAAKDRQIASDKSKTNLQNAPFRFHGSNH